MAAVEEQHFILRVQDPELAGRLRGWLRESGKESDNIEDVRLLFESTDDRKGVLTVKAADGEVQQHDVYLQDLPTVVESYKTLDDANLVKVTDIGQVLLVADDAFKASIRNPYGENIYACKDGVTPPMRKARQRHFKPAITLPAPHMQEAVRDVMEILAGRAPDGYVFQDIEEEWVIGPDGQGKWQEVKPSKQPRAAAAAAAAEGTTKTARAGRAASRKKGHAGDSDVDEDFEMTDSD